MEITGLFFLASLCKAGAKIQSAFYNTVSLGSSWSVVTRNGVKGFAAKLESTMPCRERQDQTYHEKILDWRPYIPHSLPTVSQYPSKSTRDIKSST